MSFHVILLFLVFILSESFPKVTCVAGKTEFCSRLNCRKENVGGEVCGLRTEGEGFRLKLFESECELFKYGCSVDESNAYGLISIDYCDRSFRSNYTESVPYIKNDDQNRTNEVQTLNDILNITSDEHSNKSLTFNTTDKCSTILCDNKEKHEVCGIREDGNGFRIRPFQNFCELTKYNCENDQEFITTDLFICKTDLNKTKQEIIKNNYVVTKNEINGQLNNDKFEHNKEQENNLNASDKDDINKINRTNKVKTFVVINSKIFGKNYDINDSIDTFFAASHVFDLPLKEVNLDTRRRLLKYAGPIKVFVPWITKPKKIINDTSHRPTLNSCYHKCPYKCPDTYAPVCGVPGVVAREPSLMFQNHCFMDVAQCKMSWENKSSTSHSSYYVESSFLFCMGDEMNAVYRFLPAIRTLQHMGRLKKKGKFRAVLRNFRFVSEFRFGRPKFMGK